MRHVVALAIALLLLAGGLSAATFDPVSDAQLVDRAELIVIARVLDSTPRAVERGTIFTDHRLEVERVLKGNAKAAIVTVSEFGGSAGDLSLIVPGGASYSAGSRVLTFLRQRPDGTYSTAFMGLGVYQFTRARSGADVLVRRGDGIVMEGQDAFDARPAREFVDYISAGAPESANRPATVHSDAIETEPAPDALPAAYTFTHPDTGNGVRWNAGCDVNCTIGFILHNTQTSTHALSVPQAFEDAAGSWANDPESGLNFEVAGFGTETVFDSPGDSFNDLIFDYTSTFPSFCSEPGARACTVLTASSVTHTYRGSTFNNLVAADIAIRKSTTLTQSVFTMLLAHEVGHALAFRHSDAAVPSSTNALMRSTLPENFGHSLRAWDQEAVAEVYGDGFVAPCNSPNVTSTSGGGTFPEGSTSTLSVSVSGTSPFSYQWYRGQPGDTSQLVGTASSFQTPPITQTMTFWVRVSNSCPTNNTDDSPGITVQPEAPCDEPIITVQPLSQQIISGNKATLSIEISGTAPLTTRWYEGSVNTDESKPQTTGTSFSTPILTSTKSYWAKVTNACGTARSSVATVTVTAQCVPPTIASQSPSATLALGGSTTLSVTPAGTGPFTFQWFEGDSPSIAAPVAGGTTSSLAVGPFNTPGAKKYWVRVTGVCGSPAIGGTIVLTVDCGISPTPELSAPGVAYYGAGYQVSWTSNLAQTSSFELQEATDPAFTVNLKTFVVSGALSHQIDAHSEISTDTRFYYRVRGFNACTNQPTAYSPTASTVVSGPLPSNSKEFSIVVPFTTTSPIVQNLLVPGFGEDAKPTDTFAVSTDAPWLTIFPSTGALSAGGTTVQMTINPVLLDIGSTTGTIIIARTQLDSSRGGVATNGTTTLSLPLTVSKVTPVTPAPRTTDAPAGTLLIPAVAHADGVGTRFQSDIRITNASSTDINYELSFTPSATAGTQTGKQLQLLIKANESKGLDDIVKAWFGSGTLGEAGLGTLEIRPLNGANPLATFASSRTYAVTAKGTLGQFIPAIPLANFIKNITEDPLARISLQQIANSPAFRTNLGFVEGAGLPAQMLVTLRDGNNNIIKQVEKILPPYGHEQLPLASAAMFGPVVVADGRVEVQVIGSGGGKVSAYASVIDNKTSDPLLVFPEQALRETNEHYVVPGIAELENGVSSNFHSDMRVYNAAQTPVTVTLNYYPQAGDNTPRPPSKTIELGPGEVEAIDNVLPTLWGLARTGGAVTADAPAGSQLVLTARTYSRDAEGGTYGQFIPGVTAADAVGLNERSLEVLQLEQSAQYRTNLGLVEVTGNPVTVELRAQTGAKTTAVTHVGLSGNQFLQIGRIFEQMGLGTSVYTGRVSVSVVGGTGRVAAYGSVVDNRTVDPTYVPSQ